MHFARLIFAFTLFLIPLLALSQFSGLGVSGGGTASSFEYGDQVNNLNDFEEESSLGTTAGIQFDFDLGNEYTKLSPELFFIQNGAKEFFSTNDLVNDLIDRQVHLDYVGLYLPFQIYVPMDDGSEYYEDIYHGINFNFSGFIDYAINGEVENDQGEIEEITFARDIDKIDLGVSVSTGLWANGFGLVFGYNYGLKNIEFNEALGIGLATDSENYLINNRGFTLLVGYRGRF